MGGQPTNDCSDFKDLWIDRISIDKNQWHKKFCQLPSWGLILQKMMNGLVPWEETHYMLGGSEGWFTRDNKKNSPIFSQFLKVQLEQLGILLGQVTIMSTWLNRGLHLKNCLQVTWSSDFTMLLFLTVAISANFVHYSKMKKYTNLSEMMISGGLI